MNADEWRDEVALMTEVLRRSELPFWVDLRRELRARDVEPELALLVESYDEPPQTEIGAVVAEAGHVLVYERRGGRWSWRDVTATWQQSEFAEQIRVGFEML